MPTFKVTAQLGFTETHLVEAEDESDVAELYFSTGGNLEQSDQTENRIMSVERVLTEAEKAALEWDQMVKELG